MAIIQQGLVLMAAGVGIVFLFLAILIVVTKCAGVVQRFDHILPQEAKKTAPKKAAADDDANIALAIAVALG
ncbi:MAG: OadG family transporter subunit [Kiritimatiellia bacterium]